MKYKSKGGIKARKKGFSEWTVRRACDKTTRIGRRGIERG